MKDSHGTDLIEVSAHANVKPDAVMNVLTDGWLFGLWVVGASHIRDVDADWPQPGSKIHHAVGAWPLLIRDATEARAYEPDGMLELLARGWPLGAAMVRIEVVEEDGGSRIVLGERIISGPGTVLRPVEHLLVPPRNKESLGRLVALTEGRSFAGRV
jgi:hypothetical protein